MKLTMMKSVLVCGLALSAPAIWADELLSGPYYFDSSYSVHVKPAMLGDGWGMTTGVAVETVINNAVTTGVEVNVDIPVVPYPADPSEVINMASAGLRLGAIFGSSSTFHVGFNNTLGVGLSREQTYVIDESSLNGELNVTKSIRVFAGAGYRYTYGLNYDAGLTDDKARGLFLDVGIRYGELGR